MKAIELKDVVRVDGKVFQKTRMFGNWQARVVHSNKKLYSRKRDKALNWD